jgi:hypothetical protein
MSGYRLAGGITGVLVSPKSTSLLHSSRLSGAHAMAVHDSAAGGKQHYTTPELTPLGTLKDITLMRFNWQGRREWGEEPIGNVS